MKGMTVSASMRSFGIGLFAYRLPSKPVDVCSAPSLSRRGMLFGARCLLHIEKLSRSEGTLLRSLLARERVAKPHWIGGASCCRSPMARHRACSNGCGRCRCAIRRDRWANSCASSTIWSSSAYRCSGPTHATKLSSGIMHGAARTAKPSVSHRIQPAIRRLEAACIMRYALCSATDQFLSMLGDWVRKSIRTANDRVAASAPGSEGVDGGLNPGLNPHKSGGVT
jgi:hypothetical protein